jgi:hypothetical protein
LTVKSQKLEFAFRNTTSRAKAENQKTILENQWLKEWIAILATKWCPHRRRAIASIGAKSCLAGSG